MVRRLIAPRKAALFAGRRAERCAVILGLGRKPSAAPARVGGGLVVCRVDRRVDRQWKRLEHAAPVPRAVTAEPEVRRLRAGRVDELEVLTIGDVRAIDVECPDLDAMAGILVVPPERIIAAESG